MKKKWQSFLTRQVKGGHRFAAKYFVVEKLIQSQFCDLLISYWDLQFVFWTAFIQVGLYGPYGPKDEPYVELVISMSIIRISDINKTTIKKIQHKCISHKLISNNQAFFSYLQIASCS